MIIRIQAQYLSALNTGNVKRHINESEEQRWVRQLN
jgi:hypothetical protein